MVLKNQKNPWISSLIQKFIGFDQIVLFFTLNPFNPVTIQDKEVLYNDFVHDHGRRLAIPHTLKK